ncbi:MAG TPA: ABC transporter permease [Thermoplasmata archaeon]|nr:ABC transporter permease [Thermoplasmata archaeon]
MSAPKEPAAPPTPRRARPHPRLDQAKRSWFFFRRNTLALIGLAILVLLATFATYAVSQPIPWYKMQLMCGADYGPLNNDSGYPNNFSSKSVSACNYVCTYEVKKPPNADQFCGGLWYKTPTDLSESHAFAGLVPPTDSLSPLTAGPLPLGALGGVGATSIDSASFYNLYSGLLRGSDWSLMFSVGIVGLGALLGLVVGAVAGFYGGVVDDALMRLVDIFLSIPVILFVVVVIAVTSLAVPNLGGLGTANTKLLMLVIGFAAVWWPFYARLVRGQVLVVREQKYVEAARASGASKARILGRHIIPNSVYPIFIQFSLDVGTIPLLIGSLAYLGFGNQIFPNQGYFPEWGNLAQLGINPILAVVGTCTDPSGCVIPWWQLFFPGLFLFLFAISVNLLSDGLRDAFDPRLRR